MLIVSMGERQPIVAFNTKTREFDVFKDTLYSGLDGIQADDPGASSSALGSKRQSS